MRFGNSAVYPRIPDIHFMLFAKILQMTFEEFKQRHQEQVMAHRHHGHEEEDIQRRCVRWFRAAYPEIASLLFHPNNEPFFGGIGKTEMQKAKAGARAKAMGVTTGVADLILLVHEHWPTAYNGGSHALCIEMKTMKGRPSDSQKKWKEYAELSGNKYVICRSEEEFEQIIFSYLDKKPMSNRNILNSIVNKSSK